MSTANSTRAGSTAGPVVAGSGSVIAGAYDWPVRYGKASVRSPASEAPWLAGDRELHDRQEIVGARI
jgi:hypothetical protein